MRSLPELEMTGNFGHMTAQGGNTNPNNSIMNLLTKGDDYDNENFC